MASIDAVLDGIVNDIKAQAPKVLGSAASQIANEMTDYTRTVISDFYGSYGPHVYQRHGGLNNSFKRYYKNGGTIFHGGVELLPDSMGSYPSIFAKYTGKAMSSSAIFEYAIMQGRHGNTEQLQVALRMPLSIPPVSTPPIELIEKKRDEIVGNIESYIHFSL